MVRRSSSSSARLAGLTVARYSSTGDVFARGEARAGFGFGFVFDRVVGERGGGFGCALGTVFNVLRTLALRASLRGKPALGW
jgi:hypothetical protein